MQLSYSSIRINKTSLDESRMHAKEVKLVYAYLCRSTQTRSSLSRGEVGLDEGGRRSTLLLPTHACLSERRPLQILTQVLLHPP